MIIMMVKCRQYGDISFYVLLPLSVLSYIFLQSNEDWTYNFCSDDGKSPRPTTGLLIFRYMFVPSIQQFFPAALLPGCTILSLISLFLCKQRSRPLKSYERSCHEGSILNLLYSELGSWDLRTALAIPPPCCHP
jgi:hypothetical protein